MSLLTLENVSYRLPRGRELFSELSVKLKEGEALHIYGPNGSGKSTLIQLILGKVKSTRGRVARSTNQVAYLPQLQSLEFHLPVTLQDVLDILLPEIPAPKAVTGLGLLTTAQLGLLWNTASGGERQRTLLTALLLRKPELLVLDEPLNHLDRATRESLIRSLGKYLSAEKGRALVLVSHLSVSEMEEFGTTVRSIGIGDES